MSQLLSGTPHCRCHNGGHCDTRPPHPCVCTRGWAGLLCDTPTCQPGCEHGGVCVRPDVCACQPGYTGTMVLFEQKVGTKGRRIRAFEF